MNKKLTFRKAINTLHLWVGVPSALVLFIVCLTGTLYVFQKEITHWIDADKYTLPASASPRMDVSALITTLEAASKGLKVSVIQMPEKGDEAWLVTMAAGGKKETKTLLLVDPFTGRIQGDAKTPTYRFFEKVIELHRWLLLDHKIGAVITGTSALLFVLLEITGLILWLPPKLKSWKKRNAWKPGFTVKVKAGWKRINHDLHKTLGFYTFLLITILGLTGPYFGFEWYRTGYTKLMGATLPKKESAMPEKEDSPSTPAAPSVSSNSPLTTFPDSLLLNAEKALPYKGDIRINLPKSAKGSITLLKVRTGFFASAAVDRIDFEAGSGKIKKIDRFANRSTGEKIVSLTRAIHTGEIFGTFSKIIYCLVCLIATSLPITGIMIWLNKRRKKPVRQSIPVPANSQQQY